MECWGEDKKEGEEKRLGVEHKSESSVKSTGNRVDVA